MSFLINDNSCSCSHPRSSHIHGNKLEPRWCEFAQRACDCWNYVSRDLKLKELSKLEIVIER